jgi:hypothetical protein
MVNPCDATPSSSNTDDEAIVVWKGSMVTVAVKRNPVDLPAHIANVNARLLTDFLCQP